MAKKATRSSQRKSPKSKKTKQDDVFALRSDDDPLAVAAETHVLGDAQVCSTDSRGYATPGNRSPLEIVLDASEGFIPLWAEGSYLRWRFNESSMAYFRNPSAAKDAVRVLFAEAVHAWGDAAPVKFSEREEAWDFELVMRNSDNCNSRGCTLASAFFPDSGRHELIIYPKMFTQSRKEQIDTLTHEIGHAFGLRHFFANISENAWPSEIFGKHKPFSIMNYGKMSELTEDDKSDLKSLYQQVWSGKLTEINGTRVVQFQPVHQLGGLA